MPTYLFTYRVPEKPMQEAVAELDEAGRSARFAAWTDWFQSMGSSVVEKGNPVSDASTVGETANTRVGGYSLVDAPTAARAAEFAKACPAVQWGGGVEIGEILDMSDPQRNGAAGERAGSAA